LIDPVTGVLSRQNQQLDQRTTQFQSRITNLDKLLEAKRARLERQFSQLETVLASLQNQQSALGQIQTIQPLRSRNS
jgi:flagellar hook-associated protein 2